MKQFHNLSGQNLLRHELIESHFRNLGFDCVVSDSVNLRQQIILLFSPRSKVVFHFLELYTFSFVAFFSELKFRVGLSLFRPLSLAKLLVSFSILFAKVMLFKLIIKNNSIIILSSELRKEFVEEIGFINRVIVLRNKPVYSRDDIINVDTDKVERIKRLVLTGNLNNRPQFLDLCRKLENIDIIIYCYGISNSDKRWVATQGFSNVAVLDSIPSHDVPHVLSTSSHAICLYSESSYNQRYSASSKIFEILFWGAIPIVNSNLGLLSELNKLNAQYINIQDLIVEDMLGESLEHDLYRSEACLFSSEMVNLDLKGNV